jgi:hypothetical protein
MDNRKLGWIAIGIGVVALLVAFGGRSRPMGWYNNGPQFGYGPQAVAPAAPPAPQQWSQPPGPQQQGPGPQQWSEPQGRAPQAPQAPQQRGGPRDRFGGQPGWGGPHGFGGFFLFRLFGGLLRSVLFLLILFLLVRWFWHRRNGQTPPPAGPSSPGPEQPPYTGGTQAL